jgi:hypothetical protein
LADVLAANAYDRLGQAFHDLPFLGTAEDALDNLDLNQARLSPLALEIVAQGRCG